MTAFDDVQRKGWASRESLFGARGEVAKAMRGETFDSTAFNEVLEKQQANLDALKKSVREGLQQIHEAMTPEQRGQLADLVEFGPRHFGHGHHGHFGRHGHHGASHGGPGPQSVNL